MLRDLDIEQIQHFIEKTKVFQKFKIADVFLEDRRSNNIVYINGVKQNESENFNSGYAIRGFNPAASNQDEIDRVIWRNTLDTQKIQEDINTMASLSNDMHFIPQNPIVVHNNIFINEIISSNQIDDLIKDAYEYLQSKFKETVKLENSQISFSDSNKHWWISNNLGTQHKEKQSRLQLLIKIVVSKNNNTNNFYILVRSTTGLQKIKETYKNKIDELYLRVSKMIEASSSIKGTYPIVFHSGNPGVLIHEAIGHGLEIDAIKKNASAFCDKIGHQIASKGVTIEDDGTIAGEYGSMNLDDEGMKPKKNILVEDGILKSYLCDRKNAFLMDTESTGSGRRQNFQTPAIPRMTNTYLKNHNPENNCSLDDMMKKYDELVYVVSTSHGAVDTASGQFSFTCDEAYFINNKTGSIEPIANCVFSGMGRDVLKNIEAIGETTSLDPGWCGKNGSYVPVTCGQQAILVNPMTLG